MKNNKETEVSTESISHSKQKRIERQKKAAKKKATSLTLNIVAVVICVVIIGLIAWGITTLVIKASKTVVASSDYSAELNDNGFVKGVTAGNYVGLCNYRGIEVPLSEVEYPDSSVEEDIKNALSSHQVLETEDVVVKDGDKVNIDYVGTIDGVEFEGGSAEGYDLTIGSGSFIDDFEQQLIDYRPGEVAIVNVTFPEDYQSADLQGKDAEFTVTVNGVYVDPELDDDFIAAYYGSVANTVDEYKQYLKDSNYETNLTEYVTNYLSENSTISKYPRAFLKNVKSTGRYSDEQSYEYMNQMYMQYYGGGFSSFEEYTGKSEEEYLEQLDTDSKEQVKNYLIYQAILENEGIVPTVDDLKAQYGDDDTFNAAVESSGQGYLMLNIIKDKAIEIAKNNAIVK